MHPNFVHWGWTQQRRRKFPYPLFLRGTKSEIHRHDLSASASFSKGAKSSYKTRRDRLPFTAFYCCTDDRASQVLMLVSKSQKYKLSIKEILPVAFVPFV